MEENFFVLLLPLGCKTKTNKYNLQISSHPFFVERRKLLLHPI
jgi:hypothetical protein